MGGHASLASVLPAHVVTAEDMHAYRAIALSRGTTAAVVALARGLVTTEIAEGITTFTAPDVATRLRVVFLHGGGLIAGDRFDGVDVLARHAATLGLEVWTAEYPLVPEARHDEILAGLVEIVRLATADGLPVVLAGQSAGGGLAASVALACRDRGVPLVGLQLICPMLDRRDTVSATQYADDPSWSRASNEACWDAALDGTTSVAPGDSDDLAGLPPTFLDVGGAELFRDSVVSFASRLWAAGNSAELHVWSGGFHASDCVVEDAVVSEEAHRARERWLHRLIDDAL